ncbi:MAG: glycosyltransferase family 61 protein [Bacteroidales bacterium]|nr:glycosyltransferase family 61 protein [Candidatus Liminaster caballi]
MLLNIELRSTIYENAIILPVKDGYNDNGCLAGGVLDGDGSFIENSAFSVTKGCSYEYDHVEQEEDEVIYIGSLLNIFGHTFTDNLKKLWYLCTDECRKRITDGAKVVYITTGNQPLASYSIRFFELAGFDLLSWHHVTHITRCKSCIIPDDSFGCEDIYKGGFYTKEFGDIIATIKNNVTKTAGALYPEKIYFTRSKIPNNQWREMGEECIEKVFAKMGYSIISPEKLELETQLNLLMHCKEFAATEGSVSHGAVFCKPGTKVIIIRKVDQTNHCQLVLNQVAGVDVTYINAHRSVQATADRPNWGPFYMCITPELESFVGHKIFHLPLCLRPSWWWYNYRNRKIVKRFIACVRHDN